MAKIKSLLFPIVLALFISIAASFGLRTRQSQSSDTNNPAEATTDISNQSTNDEGTPESVVPSSNNSFSTKANVPPTLDQLFNPNLINLTNRTSWTKRTNSTNSTNGNNLTAPISPTAENLKVFSKLTGPSETNLDRIVTIWENSTFVFDFNYPKSTSLISAGFNGYITEATRKNFPALFLNSLSMTVGYLGPCGLHTPHFHPRATEMAFGVYGTFYTGFLAENGAPLIMNMLFPGQTMLFGRGGIHWVANLQCEPGLYISAFNDEDPGMSNLAQNLFSLPEDVVSPTMGFLDPLSIDILAAHIPQNVTLGIAECLARCGVLF